MPLNAIAETLASDPLVPSPIRSEPADTSTEPVFVFTPESVRVLPDNFRIPTLSAIAAVNVRSPAAVSKPIRPPTKLPVPIIVTMSASAKELGIARVPLLVVAQRPVWSQPARLAVELMVTIVFPPVAVSLLL